MRKVRVFLIIMLLSLSACGGGGEKIPDNIPPADITAAVTAQIEIPSAVEKTMTSLLNYYYDADEALLEDMSLIICASGAFPDELAVFKLKNADDADTVIEFIDTRLRGKFTDFRDYTPNEMYKLDGAVIGTRGRYVYYIVCSDNSRAESIIKGLLS